MSVFNEDLSLDINSTISHAENVILDGCHGAVIFGSTGQSQLISSTEKKELIEKLNDSKFKDNFIVGTGSNSLNENIELMKCSQKSGINKFLLMPPAYYKYEDEGAYAYYSNIIERVPESKIILYNFEKLSGYKFSIKVIEKLVKDFPNQIVGVKDSTYNLYENLNIDNFSILPGSELKLLKGLELGCSGIITATCNVTADLSRKVYDDFKNKKDQKYNEKLCNVRAAFDKYNLISGMHSFLSDADNCFNNILPPLSLLDSKEKEKLFEELNKLDFNSKFLKVA